MKIKESLYTNLTPATRIKAALNAAARQDDAEIKRLVATCPKRSYTTTDAAFSDTMNALMQLSLAVEADKRGQALWFLLALREGDAQAAQDALAKLNSLHAAWGQFLTTCSLDPSDMQGAGAPAHSYVELFIKPNFADEALTARYCKELLQGFSHKTVFNLQPPSP